MRVTFHFQIFVKHMCILVAPAWDPGVVDGTGEVGIKQDAVLYHLGERIHVLLSASFLLS